MWLGKFFHEFYWWNGIGNEISNAIVAKLWNAKIKHLVNSEFKGTLTLQIFVSDFLFRCFIGFEITIYIIYIYLCDII